MKDSGLEILEQTKNQITKVQIWLAKAMLPHKRLQTVHRQYQPSKIFYKYRNSYEGLRITKLKLINHGNNLLNSTKDN